MKRVEPKWKTLEIKESEGTTGAPRESKEGRKMEGRGRDWDLIVIEEEEEVECDGGAL